MGRLQRIAEHRGDNGNLVWRDHYEYDRYGNRWQSSYENTGRPYVETSQNDYDPATNRFIAPWWQYDAAGNLTEDQIFGYQSHVYDAKSRNVSVTSLATQQVVSSAVYDGLGQRVQTTEGSVTRRQVYDASGMVIAEYENNVLKRECIYGNGELLSTVEPGNGVRHQLNDQQGSSRVVMDDNGLIKARHDYYPFGEEIGYVGTRLGSQGYGQVDGNRKRYAGMEKDGPTGQDQTWFRKADTRSGRWTSPDPLGGSLAIGDPQSTNRYTYVNNDPLNYTDPTGLLLAAGCYALVNWTLFEDGTIRINSVDYLCFGGGGGTSGLGGDLQGGGGGGGQLPTTLGPQEEVKTPCNAPYRGSNVLKRALTDIYLNRTGLSQFVTEKKISQSGEGYVLNFSSIKAARGFVSSSQNFTSGGSFGASFHVEELGQGPFSDYRSRRGSLGDRSLQVVFGAAGAYVDTDRYNFTQGIGGFFGHAIKEVLPYAAKKVGEKLGIVGSDCK